MGTVPGTVPAPPGKPEATTSRAGHQTTSMRQKAMGDRQEFKRAVKAAAWERCRGCCEGCGHQFQDGEREEYDHIVPDALRKNASLENCQVLCAGCHLEKTKGDVTRIAKAKRVSKKHEGTFRPTRNVIPGSKASHFRRSLSGKVTIRKTGETIREPR